MRKAAITTLGILVPVILLLAGCSGNVNVTVADATTVTTFSSEKYIWEQIKQNHEGTINVQGVDYYYRLVGEDDEEVIFQGVKFVPDYASYLISQGEFIVGPYTYYALAEFEDGTNEGLVHGGFFDDQEIYIGISDHINPSVGVMQIRDKNADETALYLLVSLT
jgi:hypothetical protein